MTTTVTDATVPLEGLDIAVRHWGAPAGLPVLALHGWLDNAASFDAMAPQMPALRLCAMDFAGHGLSGHRPPGAAYHFIDNVTDALAVADALGWERFSLLAHSMGAGVGVLLAAAFPDRVQRCVFLDGFGPLSSAGDEAAENLRTAVRQQLATRAREPAVFATLEECAKARVVGGHTRVGMAAARVLAARNARRSADGYRWRTDGRLRYRSLLRLTEEQVCGFVAAIEAPMLVLQATEGLARFADRYAARLSAARDLTIETVGGGHHFHLEAQAGEAAARAQAFLTG
ncbi:MAG: alpha/beta hydrolase [Pseudomonadota bacterium]